MSIEITINDGVIVIAGEMTIYAAAEMKQQLLAALTSGSGELVLNLARVSELDTCGVQLMLALQVAAAKASRKLRVTAVSTPVAEVLSLYGLQSVLGMREAA